MKRGKPISVAIAAALCLVGCKRSDPTAAEGVPVASASASVSAPTGAPLGKLPEVEGTAAEIVDGHQKDKARYAGKLALVFGVMGETGKDDARGSFVTLPKSPDDHSKDAPAIKCLLKSGEEAAIGSRTRGDKIDVAGVLEEADGGLLLRNCVVDTQLRVCRAVREALGRGTCEPDKDKLGARWMIGTEAVEIACQSPGGFSAWSKEWAAIPKEQQMKTKAAVDTTACRAVPDSVNPRLIVDLTAALARIRWVDSAPTLAP